MRPVLPSVAPGRRSLRMVLAALLALAALLGAARPAHAALGLTVGGSTGMTRIGPAPRIPAGATATGAVPAATPVQVTIALAPRDPVALAAYAQAVATPTSPDYHHYLTVPEFAARFGATPAQVAAVQSALRADGLSPSGPSANGLSLSLQTSAQTASTAFATGLEDYRLAGGRRAVATTSAPAVPSPVAGLVQGIVGLSSLSLPTPSGVARRRPIHPGLTGRGARAVTAAPRTASAPGSSNACFGARSSGAYTAGQIASAYGFSGLYGAGDGGAGQTIAVFELEPFSASDVQAYQSCYGTHASVSTVAVDGGPGTGSGSGEAALDIEDIVGLAPQASVVVYQGPNSGSGAYDTYAKIINEDRAKVISTSWGACESPSDTGSLQAENTLFEEAAAQGQSVLAAAGDSGADDCGNAGGAAVDDPASQPYVTGVGGTTMSTAGNTPVESVWNSSWSGGSGAGGGGVSAIWPMPAYQTSSAIGQTQITCGSGRTACREVPDVTADADVNTGYAIYYAGGWYAFGGTSAAAPTWAALVTLSDASSACSGPLGFLNPSLYSTQRSIGASTFHDVTSGNNSFDGVTGYSAAVGYDLASGLGSPQGSALASALCGAQSAAAASASSGATSTPVTASTTPGGGTTTGTGITTTTTGTGTGTGTGTTTGGPATTPTTPIVTPAPTPPPVTAPAVKVVLPARVTGAVGRRLRIVPRGVDSAGLPLTWRASGLPAGLVINAATGVISGIPVQAAQVPVTLWAADADGGSGQAATAVTIAGATRVSTALTFPSAGRLALRVRAAAGRYSSGIHRLVIRARGDLVRAGRSGAALAAQIVVRDANGRRLVAAVTRRGTTVVISLRRAVTVVRVRFLAGVRVTERRAVAAGVDGPPVAFRITVS